VLKALQVRRERRVQLDLQVLKVFRASVGPQDRKAFRVFKACQEKLGQRARKET
jgi:hypothetical protein